MPSPGTSNRKITPVMAVLALQVLCILFLATEATLDLFGLELEDMLGTRDVLEFLVILALVLGAIFLGRELRDLLRRQRAMEDQLRAASGAFAELL